MFFLFSDKVLRLQEVKTRAGSLASVDETRPAVAPVAWIAFIVREAEDLNLDALRSYRIKSSKCARLVGSSLCTSVSSDSPARAARPRFLQENRKNTKNMKNQRENMKNNTFKRLE